MKRCAPRDSMELGLPRRDGHVNHARAIVTWQDMSLIASEVEHSGTNALVFVCLCYLRSPKHRGNLEPGGMIGMAIETGTCLESSPEAWSANRRISAQSAPMARCSPMRSAVKPNALLATTQGRGRM